MQLEGKVAIVTGAGSGVGREVVLNLLKKGVLVAGVDINQKGLDESANLAEVHADRFVGIRTDISDRASWDYPTLHTFKRFRLQDN